ncbi:MAG TPA: 5-dehydro-2-deoxygluconokinase [Clostridiales bacterium]|nr:MAG: 5-dehydro-2-deoxygluconokinase [Firmicutes bacterium ADurb.Bin262]HOU11201.1 5-dehydro-2-deoxygluconokinase [Clostridiales bacterium]HQH63420.1 5-dehydro-2-deoxygluconokinase [Clostridiales bacterium]HQK72734.1 5-dehydro-2-deoxygluconokinase [Clostridiales bacterium]
MNLFEFPKDRTFDVIPIGRIAIDFNPTDLNRPLKESSNFNKYVGGSPANIAVGLARLGAKVGFIARVSDDQFGDYVTDYFKKDGIDTSHIFRCVNGEKIGLTFTEILSPTESSILMYRYGAADLQVCTDDVDEDYVKSAKAVVISGTALCASPSREAALKMMMLAKKNGVVVIFDIDYRPYTWKNPDEVSIYYTLAARSSDIVLGSREEFNLTEAVTGVCADDKASAARWHGYGNKIVIIKHGKEGSVAYLKDGRSYRVRPFPVKALKGFGGGDGYASAFIYSLLRGKSMPDALEYATASASMLVSAHSCSAAMPTADAINAFIKESREKYGEVVERLT